jgi:hypothetical protein
MSSSGWFDDLPVLGRLPPRDAALKLRELGELDAAATLESDQPRAAAFGRETWWWPFQDRAWQHTAHAFGYLAPGGPTDELVSIEHAGNISADTRLRNARVRVGLDRLRVADYPGGGTHRVLFDFYAQNQVPENVEHLHFGATFRIRQGEQAAVLGYPIFVGLNVGPQGIAFNDADEAFLGFLESDAFRQGLKLATTVQPAIGLFSETALGLTKAIAKRNRNVPVQDFYMGLDFDNIRTGARLAEGSYIAVQIPESFQTIWNWNDWVYNPHTGHITSRDRSATLIPYNYAVFSISRYAGS